MVFKIRAHFDGKVIVPDEPVELPVDRPLLAELTVAEDGSLTPAASDRQAAYGRLISRRVSGSHIPDDALRRQNMYEDR